MQTTASSTAKETRGITADWRLRSNVKTVIAYGILLSKYTSNRSLGILEIDIRRDESFMCSYFLILFKYFALMMKK
jgi:hypothetical protein